ncbi:MAG: bifunctional nuclease family protein [Bacteroidetes bacterium]|nr:bifunctional nuclease family protein [Bacteroidota bacterium]MBS1740145.1 bifunctional nuclease family protein [Bacteroidota bacterium]MBS1775372.1 bifunctional nuclease family protein [Bacteroidota bacterium]
MKKIELEIVALSHSITQTHSYAVVLGEVNGLRRLPIVIGGFEAQAIAVALERMQPSRPLTHDLFANFMSTFGIDLNEVVIYKLEDGIFFARLVCQGVDGEPVEIDSRTSDALALAVRANCRIYTYENILDTAGLYLTETQDTPPPTEPTEKAKSSSTSSKVTSDKDLKSLSIEELNTLLQQVLEQEDYVRAITIRDEINTRKK